MSLKYVRFGSSIAISLAGKDFLISEKDVRFEQIVKSVENEDEESLLSILSPTSLFNREDISVRDGVVFYKEESLPSSLGELMLKYKIEEASLSPLLNVWLNIKNRQVSSEEKFDFVRLLEKGAYPFTKDGFVMVYQGDEIHTVSNGVISFYNYSLVDNYFKMRMNRSVFLEDLIEKTFGFSSKSLKKEVKNKMLDKRGTVNDSPLKMGLIFKDRLSNDGIVELVSSSSGTELLNVPVEDCLMANSFFLTNFTEKKIKSLIKKTGMSGLISSSYYYGKLLHHNVKADLTSLRLQRWEDYSQFLRNEYKKIVGDLVFFGSPLYEEIKSVVDKNPIRDYFKGAIQNAVICLPFDKTELVEWGQKMNNCVGGKGSSMMQDELMIFAIKSGDEVLYNISLRKNKITEMKAKKNRPVPPEIKNIIKRWFKDVGLTN